MLQDLPFLSVGVRRGSASSPTPTDSFLLGVERGICRSQGTGGTGEVQLRSGGKGSSDGWRAIKPAGMMPDLPPGGNYLPTSAGLSLTPLCRIRSSWHPFGMSLLVPVPPSSSSSPRAGSWFQSSPTGSEFRLVWEALRSWPLCEIHPAEDLLN